MIIKGLFTSTIYRGDLDLRVTLIPGFFNFSILKILRFFSYFAFFCFFQFFNFQDFSLISYFAFLVYQFFKPGIFQFSILKISRFEWYRCLVKLDLEAKFDSLRGVFASFYIGLWAKVCLVNYRQFWTENFIISLCL